jgi:L-ascorbate metabolism protein UlaG (beta-lactamase superfamily)
MKVTWLGWAGVEVESRGQRVVIDPLDDPAAVFAFLADRAAGIKLPEVGAGQPGAVAGMVTHLHRDHADATALRRALAPGAPLYEPEDTGGNGLERAAIAQADQELAAAGIKRRQAAPWTSVEIGPFVLTALPAVDGTGDPQLSWLIESGNIRVLHLGDTMWHGWWWRIAARYGPPDLVLAPINGARLTFPHRAPASPLPGALDPEQAALAAEQLQSDRLVPIHYDGYDIPGVYEPVPDAIARLCAASPRAQVIDVGEALEL